MKKFFISKARRTRDTPYTSRIEKQGLTSYTVYNHMLLPTSFGPLEESYHHLKKHVQIWDVAGERQVEIKGKGRHDSCVVPRAVPIVESMMALTLVDHYLISKTNKL